MFEVYASAWFALCAVRNHLVTKKVTKNIFALKPLGNGGRGRVGRCFFLRKAINKETFLLFTINSFFLNCREQIMAMNTPLLLNSNILARFNLISHCSLGKRITGGAYQPVCLNFLAFLHIIETNFYKKKTCQCKTQLNIKDGALDENI